MRAIDGNTPVLADAVMRELGFTDRVAAKWYFTKRVGSDESLKITIDKATGNYEELVMDESFGQPAFYGRMKAQWRWVYREAIEAALTNLNAAGLDVHVDHTLYGFKKDEVRP